MILSILPSLPKCMRKNIYNGLSNKHWVCHLLRKKQNLTCIIDQHKLERVILSYWSFQNVFALDFRHFQHPKREVILDENYHE